MTLLFLSYLGCFIVLEQNKIISSQVLPDQWASGWPWKDAWRGRSRLYFTEVKVTESWTSIISRKWCVPFCKLLNNRPQTNKQTVVGFYFLINILVVIGYFLTFSEISNIYNFTSIYMYYKEKITVHQIIYSYKIDNFAFSESGNGAEGFSSAAVRCHCKSCRPVQCRLHTTIK